MSEVEFHTVGLDSLQKMLKELAEKAEPSNVERAMEKGAQALSNDVRALPKPRSQITKSGYTHLLDSVTFRKNEGEIEVGWGKYFGRMVENGTIKMDAQPHMRPTFNKNKEKYYKLMIDEIWR